MVRILDYGMGNLRSVQKAFEFLGEKVEISDKVGNADRLVIPGVGAFGAAMVRLASMKTDIASFARSGQPLLGICLGQQLLFDVSEEHGEHVGLELIPGKVRYLAGDGLKVPHIGWTGLGFADKAFQGDLPEASEVYFVHSLVTECEEEKDVAAWADYGGRFAAAVRRDNVWGAQFHPEKSGRLGLEIIKNWLKA